MTGVTAVIPTYNRSGFLPRAIDSVLSQTAAVDEIIVVDDGSTDATRSVVQSYGDRIKYIYQTNRGVSAARNRAVAEAKTEWIAFLDSDDEWLPLKTASQLEIARSQGADVCAGCYWLHGIDGHVT